MNLSNSRVLVQVRQIARVFSVDTHALHSLCYNGVGVIALSLHLLECFLLQDFLDRLLRVHAPQFGVVLENLGSNLCSHAVFCLLVALFGGERASVEILLASLFLGLIHAFLVALSRCS